MAFEFSYRGSVFCGTEFCVKTKMFSMAYALLLPHLPLRSYLFYKKSIISELRLNLRSLLIAYVRGLSVFMTALMFFVYYCSDHDPFDFRLAVISFAVFLASWIISWYRPVTAYRIRVTGIISGYWGLAAWMDRESIQDLLPELESRWQSKFSTPWMTAIRSGAEYPYDMLALLYVLASFHKRIHPSRTVKNLEHSALKKMREYYPASAVKKDARQCLLNLCR